MRSSTDREEGYLLEIDDLLKSFTGVHVVEGYYLRLKPGKILCIIGADVGWDCRSPEVAAAEKAGR